MADNQVEILEAGNDSEKNTETFPSPSKLEELEKKNEEKLVLKRMDAIAKLTRLIVTYKGEKRLILVEGKMTKDKVLQKIGEKLNVINPKVRIGYFESFIVFDEDVADLMNTKSDWEVLVDEPVKPSKDQMPTTIPQDQQAPKRAYEEAFPLPSSTAAASSGPSTSSPAASTSTEGSLSSALTVWPTEFPRFAIRLDVLKMLDSGENLPNNKEYFVIDSWYQLASNSGKLYPTPREYDRIVTLSLEAFPQLAGKSSYKDAFVYWKEKLTMGFQNLRRRRDSNHPSVMERKKKRSDSGEQPIKKPSPRIEPADIYGFACYRPKCRPVGETDESVKSHIAKMKEEHRRRCPNLALINASMDATYFDRRAVILEGRPLTDILSEYPCLTREEQLLKEFKRLRPVDFGVSMDATLLNSLNDMGTAILQEMDSHKRSKPPGWIRSLRHEANVEAEQDVKRALRGYAALLSIPVLLGENPELFVSTEVREGGDPYILKSGRSYSDFASTASFDVLLDSQVLIKSSEFLDAVGNLLAAIYVFNTEFPSPLKKTFEFIHVNMLGLTLPTTKMSVRKLAFKVRK